MLLIHWYATDTLVYYWYTGMLLIHWYVTHASVCHQDTRMLQRPPPKPHPPIRGILPGMPGGGAPPMSPDTGGGGGGTRGIDGVADDGFCWLGGASANSWWGLSACDSGFWTASNLSETYKWFVSVLPGNYCMKQQPFCLPELFLWDQQQNGKLECNTSCINLHQEHSVLFTFLNRLTHWNSFTRWK